MGHPVVSKLPSFHAFRIGAARRMVDLCLMVLLGSSSVITQQELPYKLVFRRKSTMSIEIIAVFEFPAFFPLRLV
jgi:hypothetical protein